MISIPRCLTYICNSCKNRIYLGLRYRCNICDDYDLCYQCYKKGKYPAPHTSSHPYSVFKEPGSTVVPADERTFTCDSCRTTIETLRFHCDECIDLDLCDTCFTSGGVAPSPHHNGHPYTTYKEPGSVKICLGHRCDVCGEGPIVGCRWQCHTCPSYDLCNVCFSASLISKGHRNSHVMTGYFEPGSIPLSSKMRTQLCRDETSFRTAEPAELRRVKTSFIDAWQKFNTRGLIIKKILKVSNGPLRSHFRNYKRDLRNRCVDPNVVKLWHGTKMVCELHSEKEACEELHCAVCSICTEGFDVRRAQANISFGRYGKGIYFAPNTCKCHAYTEPSDSSELRVMLLCKVALGTSFSAWTNMTHLTIAPNGYDSVSGEIGCGSELNWPEKVVYNNRAALPCFIVFYEYITD